jgi:hypothetical protein
MRDSALLERIQESQRGGQRRAVGMDRKPFGLVARDRRHVT